MNTLHPKIRERFANAIRDVQNDPEVLAMNGTARYSFATRSFAQQANLRRKYERGGPLAAKPGNSWHNYGCACDIVFIVNGKAKWSAKYYTGIIRKHFVKYNLENVIKNDSGHFHDAVPEKCSRRIVPHDRCGGKGMVPRLHGLGVFFPNPWCHFIRCVSRQIPNDYRSLNRLLSGASCIGFG